MKINVIGDIAGRYDEFMLLLQKMPEADLIVAVGDLVDRGSQSKQVIEWFMANQGKAIALYGNHEDMMVKYHEYPDDYNNRSMWLYNGGRATLNSYKVPDVKDTVAPVEVITWLKSLPLYYKNDELIITHAPMSGPINNLPDQFDKSKTQFFCWNRVPPYKRTDLLKFHIYGHNGELRSHTDDDGEYAMCIDNSWLGELTGLHWDWPTKEIYRQEYLDKPTL